MPRPVSSILCFFLLIIPVVRSSSQVQETWNDSLVSARVRLAADSLINGDWFIRETGYFKEDSTTIDTVQVIPKSRVIAVRADERLAYAPVREEVLDKLTRLISSRLGDPYGSYRVELYAGRRNLRDLIPNYFRSDRKSVDKNRSPGKLRRKSPPLVRNLSREFDSGSALYNINIALWHSHGWYYEPKLHRWEWQRARIFQTVEDIYPMSFTLPMLIPMLENAGATVLVPRERDWQVNEVIVDNNGSSGSSIFLASGDIGEGPDSSGFGIGNPPYVEENPFRLGTFLEMDSDRDPGNFIQYIPEIPETGKYAVYISYDASPENAEEVRYAVHHAGGITEFAVNQQMGGRTWVYLGTFTFCSGVDPEHGKVTLNNGYDNRRSKRITADAVRFGGGMGNISRNGLTGHRPRYQEAARYYLQYAGFPDTLVWRLNQENDYNDDYQSRGEWVNYLIGAPSGPMADRKAQGLGIPVDLSLAFHTDAGITGNDTVIGTLGIYSTNRTGGVLPGGLSRMSSRDLTDLVQSQIVEDLRRKYDPAWTRRAMWDRGYSEAFRPNTPSMLLELFSHQNLIDMRFGQEPEFRFDVSRAIYKGILRFLHIQYGIEEVVQPLPVDHVCSELVDTATVRITWRPVPDPLEPSAEADSYRVYTRMNGGGYNNGVPVSDTVFLLNNLHPDSIYSFRITAVNRGGESFPSEEISICISGDSRGTVLVVNAFDRTGGPAWFEDTEYAGFLDMVDQGVPWMVDLHKTGSQYDFLKSSPWLDDDSPGHGASYADLEAVVIPGNTFDFSRVHGQSILKAGYSFVTVSDEVILEKGLDLSAYQVVDYLAGEERTSYLPKNDSIGRFSVFPGKILQRLQEFLEQGGGVMISGAHIASDAHALGQDSLVSSILGYRWRTSNASRLGSFYFTDPDFAAHTRYFSFNTGIDPEIYTVEGADALEPSDSAAVTLVRYAENNMSAGVAYRNSCRVVALGFPFEAVKGAPDRDWIMRKILQFLLEDETDKED